MISDLRYVDPSSLSGGTQTRDILRNIGTHDDVIDWVLDLVANHRQERQEEKELAQIHMDMAE